MRFFGWAAVGLTFLLTNCRDRTNPEPPQYRVDARVEPYVQLFRQEARSRGKTLSIDNLTVEFGQAKNQNVCGECQLDAGQPPRILLRLDAPCWTQASEEARECLVFHELGHCLLRRPHKNTLFPNGANVSLMNSGDVSVYATCLYDIGGDVCDKRSRRAYYLDELFDETTPAPAWGR
ncbi:MAG: hypothetical protein LH606_15945 [Cytophagaceae bacterium]|nr:hypothetical protein [Cytophagaceae bacterium]